MISRSTISLIHTFTLRSLYLFLSFFLSYILEIHTNPFTPLVTRSSGEASEGHISSLSERKQRTSEIEKATQLFVLDSYWPHRSRSTPVGYFTR